MKDLLERLISIIEAHFDKIMEIATLVFIFVFATLMLAYIHNEEMSRWIENGAIIAILARTFGAGKAKADAPNTDPKPETETIKDKP
jgi:hypothetical protein